MFSCFYDSSRKYRPIINLKPLNVFIPHETFKIETLKNVKDLLQKGDLLIKIDLKNAYYAVNLAEESRKLARFQWDGNLYEYMSLVFGLGPAPRIFKKILRVPVTILRKMKIRLVTYIDDMLIFAKSQQELEMARDTVLFLLQNLGFVINWGKSVLIPTKTMEFLGVTINSEEMTFSIPDQKMQKIIRLCEQATQSSHLSERNLASIVGKLMSTAQAFSPAPLQVRYLQNLLRGSLKSKSYESMISLSPEAHLELLWWKENLALHNAQGKPLKIQPREMIITSDAAGAL